jgi:hypothetical protein
MNIIKTEIVWDVLKENDNILFILPDIRHYKTIKNPSKFQATINEILKNKNKFVIVDITNFDYSETTLRIYEDFYNIELQWIDHLSVLTDPLFLEHHTPRKWYIVKSIIDNYNFFNRVIIDDLSSTKKYNISCNHGKCYITEMINVKIYLNKLVQRLKTPLSMHQDDSTYDISLVIGKLPDNYPFDKLQEVLTLLIKYNQCSGIYCLDKTIKYYLEDFDRTLFPIVIPKKYTIDSLIKYLHKSSIQYSTHIFIGSFDKLNSPKFEKYMENNPDCIFDPFAYESCNKENYHYSTDVINMIHKFLT